MTLNRPQVRNAMTLEMVDELSSVFAVLASDEGREEVRCVVLRGAGGHFSAGGDIKDMSAVHEPGEEARQRLLKGNRAFGTLLSQVNQAAQAVVVVAEGSVMGGGLGLVCVSDVALALTDARFATPETTLGLIPAQIAPFVVQRVGLTEARRLNLTAARFNGAEARRLGLVHYVLDDPQALEEKLVQVLGQIRRCGPRALAATKGLLHRALVLDEDALLDEAARVFVDAARSDEAREGMSAFLDKRSPRWSGG